MMRNKRPEKKVLFGLCFILLLPGASDGFNDKAHESLSRRAVEGTLAGASQLDSFLLSHLGFEFPQGINQPINGQHKVIDLIAAGSVQEDYPAHRVLNHFHDPTHIWNVAGLGRVNLSSIVWSQSPVQGAGANRSWKNARDAYFAALTGATDAERKRWYAETFLTLGHLIHHVQDAAAPSHTRNNVHLSFGFLGGGPDPDRFHYWSEGPGLNMINQSQPLRFVASILKQTSANPLAPVPIARIIDKTDGDFGILSPNLNIGLAEYSNANFFSDGTVLSSAYQYPKLSQLQIGPLETAPHGAPRRYLYFRPGFGEQNYRVSTYSTMLPYIGATIPLEFVDVGIDDNVHADYGRKLFPRAIGYSAGLIDYFIRGKINMIPNPGTGAGHVIQNNTDEDMQGTFELYYDNTSNQRARINNGDFPLTITLSGNSSSRTVNFTAPPDAKDPGRYTLVFRGRLGEETDAVVGRMISACIIEESWDGALTTNYPWEARSFRFPPLDLSELPELTSYDVSGGALHLFTGHGAIADQLTGYVTHSEVFLRTGGIPRDGIELTFVISDINIEYIVTCPMCTEQLAGGGILLNEPGGAYSFVSIGQSRLGNGFIDGPGTYTINLEDYLGPDDLLTRITFAAGSQSPATGSLIVDSVTLCRRTGVN
jgi:hypothetical protein